MEPSDTALSLIISTRNRSSSLTRTLESLRKLRTCLSWELVIIDNGSSDDTQLIINRFVATFSGTGRAAGDEPKRGLANAHNAGFRKARSPICVFIDDDCYPSDDYLDAMSLCFAEDPGHWLYRRSHFAVER